MYFLQVLPRRFHVWISRRNPIHDLIQGKDSIILARRDAAKILRETSSQIGIQLGIEYNLSETLGIACPWQHTVSKARSILDATELRSFARIGNSTSYPTYFSRRISIHDRM